MTLLAFLPFTESVVLAVYVLWKTIGATSSTKTVNAARVAVCLTYAATTILVYENDTVHLLSSLAVTIFAVTYLWLTKDKGSHVVLLLAAIGAVLCTSLDYESVRGVVATSIDLAVVLLYVFLWWSKVVNAKVVICCS